MTTSRPELLLALNLLTGTDLRSEDELVTLLQQRAPDITDTALMHRVIGFAIDRGILCRTGKLLIRRQAVTEEVARAFEAELSRGEPEDPTRLAHLIRTLPQLDQRLRTVEIQVAHLHALQDPATGTVHWLQLHPNRMPRPIHDALRARAASVLGVNASEQAIATQMVLVAAQLLQQAVQPVMGRG